MKLGLSLRCPYCMQSALGTASGGHPLQRMVHTQTPGTRDSDEAKVAGAGQQEGGGLTYAPQPDDADGAPRESIATHPQGFPRGPATAVGRGGVGESPGLGQR